MITHLPTQRSTVDSYSGELHEAPELLFGSAGILSPKGWRLTVTKLKLPTSEAATVQYDLTLEAEIPESNYGKVLGNFGYPQAGAMDEYSYGYGAAGLLTELPEAILSEVREASGIKHFDAVEELVYEYGYSLLVSPSITSPWFSSLQEVQAVLVADGNSHEPHCFLRRERPRAEVFHP